MKACARKRTFTCSQARFPRRAACACHLPETQEGRLRLRRTPGVCKAFERSRLVPFVCVHTADTNSGWHGAYGRLWPGACGGTLLTALALPSKGGAYIHPLQQRLYSAREAARLQGFSDGFRLGVDEAVAAADARARFGARRVAANHAYNEYIQDKQHVHMNGTMWATLSDFVKYLGRTGKCVIEEDEDHPGSWLVTWINRDPDAVRRGEEAARRREANASNAANERILVFILI
jgi:hypothetical protein